MIVHDQNVLHSFILPSKELVPVADKEIFCKYEGQSGETVFFKRIEIPIPHSYEQHITKLCLNQMISKTIHEFQFASQQISKHILAYKALIISYPYACLIHEPFIWTVNQFIRDSSHSYCKKVNLMLSIACAIEDLHQKSCALRSLRPTTILILEQRQIFYHVAFSQTRGFQKLPDNGIIVKPLKETNSYTAPEVFQQKPHNLSCDIWSLGIIFYEILFERVFKQRIHSGKCQINFPSHTPEWTKSFLGKMITLSSQSRYKINDVIKILKKAQQCSESGNKFFRF